MEVVIVKNDEPNILKCAEISLLGGGGVGFSILFGNFSSIRRQSIRYSIELRSISIDYTKLCTLDCLQFYDFIQ